MIHVLTPEYPPQRGGVAHYTRQIARELARAGEEVHVWCPGGGAGDESDAFTVHPELGISHERDLERTGRLLDGFASPRRLLIQWVPHGYGLKGMNVPFCLWVWKRAAAGDNVEVMVHEPYVEFDARTFKQNVVAAVQRIMAALLLRAARRVWIAIPAWEPLWRPYALGKSVAFTWLPVPSSLRMADRAAVEAVRSRLAGTARRCVGHFGTYGSLVTSLLDDALPALASRCPDAHVLLIGAGGPEFHSRLVARHPHLAGRVSATGSLDDEGLAAHVAACDVLVQPYPDGISSRRTTAMAGLALGVPVVTTRGHLTEPFWETSGSVRLSEIGDSQQLAEQVALLLESSSERERLANIAGAFYQQHFDVRHAVDALRGQRLMASLPLRRLRPTTGWVAIDLRELVEFKDLVLEFARRDIKLRYRQTLLGIVWVVVQPIVAAGVLNFAFGIVAGARPQGPSYFLFTFAGVLAWNLFSWTLSKTSLSLVGNSYLISKVYFPRLILPLSGTLSTLLDFAISLVVLIVVQAIYGIAPGWQIVLLPVWIVLILGLALGAGFIAAALTVKYRDIQHILPDPDSVHALCESRCVRRVADSRWISARVLSHQPSRRTDRGLSRVARAGLRDAAAAVSCVVHRASPPACSSWARLCSSGPRESLPMPSSELAVSVQGVGKKYTLRHDHTAPTTLGEAIVRRVRHPFARAEREPFWALRDVTFDVFRGEVLALIGSNGAGKSTLLKVLSRITEMSEGHVDLYGRVGSLLEVGTGFNQELTGRENVFLNGAILGMSRTGNSAAVRRDRGVCRRRALPRHAGQALQQRHVHAAGLCRRGPSSQRDSDCRRGARRGRSGIPAEMPRKDARCGRRRTHRAVGKP